MGNSLSKRCLQRQAILNRVKLLSYTASLASEAVNTTGSFNWLGPRTFSWTTIQVEAEMTKNEDFEQVLPGLRTWDVEGSGMENHYCSPSDESAFRSILRHNA